MEINYASATEIAAAIRRGEVSSTEVLEAQLNRIEECNDVLNAVPILNIENARRRAQEADKALAQGDLWGPLHGVPFTLKDAHATAGVRTTMGFPAFDHVPQKDSTVTTRLKSAGGILVGKTNVHLLLSDALQTSNPIFGTTKNPWNPAYSPGGSSGGAAAAVASGMTFFEVGSDLAGSIRIPAHFCGIFGLKPTENRVPFTGFFPVPYYTPRNIRMMSCLGPMARTLEDLELIYSIIVGPDGLDTEIAPVPVDTMSELDFNQLKIAIAPTLANLPVAQSIQNAINNLGKTLAQEGSVVENAPLPDLNFEEEGTNFGRLVGMMLGAFQPQAESTSLAEYFQSLDQRDKAIQAWEQFFDSYDVLICAPAATSAIPHCEPGTALNVDGQEIPYELGNAHSALFNYSGHPALVIPYGQNENGLPIGIQLVAKRWSESRLLAIGRAITRITGGFQRPSANIITAPFKC